MVGPLGAKYGGIYSRRELGGAIEDHSPRAGNINLKIGKRISPRYKKGS